MRFEQKQPTSTLAPYVKSYWWVDSEGDTVILQQKIVPDGYPELVIHYADPYRINISGSWQQQDRLLLAGQIRNHFFLENTGESGMIGIKMQPTAVYELFGLDMNQFADKVVSVDRQLSPDLFAVLSTLPGNFDQAVEQFEIQLSSYLHQNKSTSTTVRKVVNQIIAGNGSVKMANLLEGLQITERQLERQFRKIVGLTPKFYSRIIRFTHIFDHIQNHSNWSDITFETGFYDQAHFIKNFKEFTGESPAAYGFDEKNLANFFLFKEG